MRTWSNFLRKMQTCPKKWYYYSLWSAFLVYSNLRAAVSKFSTNFDFKHIYEYFRKVQMENYPNRPSFVIALEHYLEINNVHSYRYIVTKTRFLLIVYDLKNIYE